VQACGAPEQKRSALELSLSQPVRICDDRMVPPEKQIREPFERTKKTVRNGVGYQHLRFLGRHRKAKFMNRSRPDECEERQRSKSSH
jgi:hypothetical protein